MLFILYVGKTFLAGGVMFTTYTIFTLIVSSAIGLLLGFIVGRKWKFPKTQKLFWFTLFLNLLAPFIGVQTFIIADSTAGTMQGLAVAPFLVCFFLMLNVLYIFRQVSMAAHTDTNKLAQ